MIPSPPEQPFVPSRHMNQKIAVSVVYVAALFMNIMDSTIVNVALPTLGREFHVRPDSVDTVAIGYLVSLAVFIPVSGWLGDRLGGRRVLLGAIVVFTGASALCGISTSLSELVFFRVVQGAGGGLMVPVGMAMLWRTFPPAERVRASSILIVPTAMAPALGPVLGGLFVTDVSWRWVFYVNVPIGLAALAFGLWYLEAFLEHPPGRFDLTGFLLSALGLGLLMYGLSEGPFRGWGSPLIVATLVAGAALLAALVMVELRSRRPIMDIRLFADRLFRSANIVLGLGSAAFIGVLFLVALFFQDGLGLSALQSGLSTFPEALGIMAGAQVVTRWLYPVFGPRRVMFGGLLALSGSLALMALVGAGTNLWWMRLLLFVLGYFMAHVFVPSQAAAFATISPADTARASTVFNVQRQVGSAVGVAVLTTVLAALGPTRFVAGHALAHLTAYHAGFLTAAGVAVLAALFSLTISDADAAETMVRRGRFARRPVSAAGGTQPAPAAGA
ncbi:MAG: MDR family MFS transporter [Acidimicrobiales bacterium]